MKYEYVTKSGVKMTTTEFRVGAHIYEADAASDVPGELFASFNLINAANTIELTYSERALPDNGTVGSIIKTVKQFMMTELQVKEVPEEEPKT